ncbi:MAG TPA: metalloregulator ArsR/SmtB family transcription factor [Candidatus Saccharimonadales bacterium]|nr:metalloregulator ArsR/SmtB family transcription factor [Candidatus Saccharimonadales bacterium]
MLTALAEPTRLKIVELLRERPRSVNEIALSIGIRQPQASKHLRALAKAGVVASQPHAQQRIYMLRPEPFLQLEDWANSFQRYWNQQLDNLENYLKKG